MNTQRLPALRIVSGIHRRLAGAVGHDQRGGRGGRVRRGRTLGGQGRDGQQAGGEGGKGKSGHRGSCLLLQ